jgi:hypothetical protein
MFNHIKSFFEVQFKNNYSSSRVLALVQVLKCSSKTILNGFIFDETILILMDQL